MELRLDHDSHIAYRTAILRHGIRVACRTLMQQSIFSSSNTLLLRLVSVPRTVPHQLSSILLTSKASSTRCFCACAGVRTPHSNWALRESEKTRTRQAWLAGIGGLTALSVLVAATPIPIPGKQTCCRRRFSPRASWSHRFRRASSRFRPVRSVERAGGRPDSPVRARRRNRAMEAVTPAVANSRQSLLCSEANINTTELAIICADDQQAQKRRITASVQARHHAFVRTRPQLEDLRGVRRTFVVRHDAATDVSHARDKVGKSSLTSFSDSAQQPRSWP